MRVAVLAATVGGMREHCHGRRWVYVDVGRLPVTYRRTPDGTGLDRLRATGAGRLR